MEVGHTRTNGEVPQGITRDRLFFDEKVEIDCRMFEDCTFKEVTLVYNGGDAPLFHDCHFKGITLQLGEQAAKVAKFLQSFYEHFEEAGTIQVERVFAAIRGDDHDSLEEVMESLESVDLKGGDS